MSPEAILPGADLRCGNLSGAINSEANLSKAALSEADIAEADLKGANLHDIDLSGADLSAADLSGADFRRTDLTSATLTNADRHRLAACRAALSDHGFEKAVSFADRVAVAGRLADEVDEYRTVTILGRLLAPTGSERDSDAPALTTLT